MLNLQKNAVTVTAATLVLSIFGAFLRWVQLVNIFDADTGLPRAGAGISYAFLLFSAAAVVGMGLFTVFTLPRRTDLDAAALLRVSGPLPAVAAWLLGAVMAVCGAALMFSAGSGLFPAARRALGVGAVAAGFCFPQLPNRMADGEEHPLARTAAVFLTLFSCLWLCCEYLENARQPLLWRSVPVLAAAALTTLAFLHVTGCFYRSAPGRTAVLACQPAVYLDLCLLSDDLETPRRAMFAACALLLLLMIYILSSNLIRNDP